MEIKTSKELIEKINELKEKVVDLSADEDLALAVMNLISMEEHLYFTAKKTGKDKYFDLLNYVREIRKKMMERLIGKPEGELWCFIKHTLSATMRLIEVGTKLQNQNKKDEAKEVFDLAYELFNIFWGIKLNVIKLGDLKKEELEYKEITEESKSGFSFKNLIEKIIDCCKE
jgi:predicted S18 family serine protease